MKLLQGRRAAVSRLCSVAAAGLLAMMLSAHAAPAPTPVTPASTPDALGEDAAAKAETRRRKLHLVRPDLIPYPIAFEVYC